LVTLIPKSEQTKGTRQLSPGFGLRSKVNTSRSLARRKTSGRHRRGHHEPAFTQRCDCCPRRPGSPITSNQRLDLQIATPDIVGLLFQIVFEFCTTRGVK